MDLSPKAIRFLIEALKQYEQDYARRLEEEDLSDDEMADLANDRQYLLALEQDLKSRHENLVEGKVSLQN